MSPHFNDFAPERIDVPDVADLVLSSEDDD